ncbi:MAG: RNA polymerase sigma factor [Verrucomicrobiota bacterium]
MSTSSLHSTAQDQDKADMRRLAQGHDHALNELMERHAENLFCYLFRLLQNEEDADDLAQETFVRVYRNRTKFDQRSSFTSWLYTIAHNLARDRFRRRRRHAHVPWESVLELEAEAFPLSSQRETPSETVQRTERAEAIRQAVAALPRQLRLPLQLAVDDEKSHACISAILRCSVKAVETRIYRARQALRASLGHWLERP